MELMETSGWLVEVNMLQRFYLIIINVSLSSEVGNEWGLRELKTAQDDLTLDLQCSNSPQSPNSNQPAL